MAGSLILVHPCVVLLDIVEKIRPLQRNRWEEVATAYNDQISGKDWCPRDADALKRRFMVLAYAKKPSEEWREFMDRAMTIHHSILEEAGASIGLGIGGLTRTDSEGMLLLTEGEAELVHAANAVHVQGFDEEYMNRLSINSAITPVRTGKRGRPPGSTTGSAAKRMAQQAEQVVLLSRAVVEMQKQLREVREALATVVETQSNQSAVLAVLQQQLGPKAGMVGSVARDNDDEHEQHQSEAYRQLLA